MKRFAILLAFSLAVSIPATAQEAPTIDWVHVRPDAATPQGENLAVPKGWSFRLDRPNADVELISDGNPGHSNIYFVNMTPGWHITTGPAAILYHPALRAEGKYRAEAKIHLFPPGERNEAFGIFVGGTNLDADDQSYLYFLIRKTGDFLIKRRSGASTSVVKEWTANPAIMPYTSDAEGSVGNVLALESGDDDLTFFVNGEQVARVPRGDLPVDGLVGLRVNHALNVHVEDLKVVPVD